MSRNIFDAEQVEANWGETLKKLFDQVRINNPNLGDPFDRKIHEFLDWMEDDIERFFIVFGAYPALLRGVPELIPRFLENMGAQVERIPIDALDSECNCGYCKAQRMKAQKETIH